MRRRLHSSEFWMLVSGWPYEVSTTGHLRRTRSRKPVAPRWDKAGFGLVTMNRGRKRVEFYLDAVVCSAFTAREISDERPLHLDGCPWNNWRKNLQWGMKPITSSGDNLVANWTVRHNGKPAGGPYTSLDAARAAAQHQGDVIIGRNEKRQVVALEVITSRNPGSWRNPYDQAKHYKAQADLHSNQMWSGMMEEAAVLITLLANDVLNYITGGDPSLVAAKEEYVGPPRSNGQGDFDWPLEARKPQDGAAPLVSTRRRLVQPVAVSGRKRLGAAPAGQGAPGRPRDW